MGLSDEYIYMNIVFVITIIMVLLTTYNHLEGFWNEPTEVAVVRSEVDGQKYIVLDLPDRQLAADQLAQLKAKLENFIEHLHLNGRERTNQHFVNGIDRVKVRFKAILSESKPEAEFTSYTVDKGRQIHMCIRERDENNRLIDENTLFFVALHELAHVMTVSVGHTKEFWRNFRFLLRQAINNGYYRYHPYHISPKKYCNTYITNTPLKLT